MSEHSQLQLHVVRNGRHAAPSHGNRLGNTAPQCCKCNIDLSSQQHAYHWMAAQKPSYLERWRYDNWIGRARYMAPLELAVRQKARMMYWRWRNTLHMKAHNLLWRSVAAGRIKASPSAIHLVQAASRVLISKILCCRTDTGLHEIQPT